MTSGGNNLKDFYYNHLTKFDALYQVMHFSLHLY